MSQTQNKSGGYRKLQSFNLASIVHLGTIKLCRRYVDGEQGSPGNATDQMVDAARSGKQNIVKGSECANTSAKSEIRSIGYAKSNLIGLQCDLEDCLAKNGELPWSVHTDDHRSVCDIQLDQFECTDDVLHDHGKYLLGQKRKYDRWLEHQNPIATVNALIILVQRVGALLTHQLESLEKGSASNGGTREHAAGAQWTVEGGKAPQCPQCGEAMRQRNSQKGPFWGCSAYPDCRGSRAM
jgi:restriction system protein